MPLSTNGLPVHSNSIVDHLVEFQFMQRNLGLYAGGDWSGKPDRASGAIDITTGAVGTEA
jgi:hypothetical protein